ncbi:MAG: hypothetical protein LBB36_02150 [Fibromonadaceae bacterium]|jgi:hypothetical protein|nr:hypothetical protein [Fibromonadaceae bacterium]
MVEESNSPLQSCKPGDYPQFGKLPEEVIQENADKLKKWIWENESTIPRERIFVSDDCILKIIDLVERRRVYFHVFHKIDMSEWNEIALYCFWITKLHPFFEVPPPNTVGRPAYLVNAIIAVRMLQNVVNKIRKREGKERVKLSLNNLIHAFCFRDISKESFMALFESLIIS